MVDEDPLFEQGGDCDLPYVPKYDFDFVDNCFVDPPPQPIFDCPDIDLPPDPPPPPPVEFPDPPPCPTFEATANVEVEYIEGSIPEATIVVTPGTSQGADGECYIDLDLDFDLKIPLQPNFCPTFVVEAEATIDAESPCSDPPSVTVNATVTQGAGEGSCEATFDFDFAFVIPPPPVSCPMVAASGNVTLPHGGYGFVNVIVSPNIGGDPCNPTCEFDFDFDFDLEVKVPDESLPCPVIYGYAAITVGGGGWSPPVYGDGGSVGSSGSGGESEQPRCGGSPSGTVTLHVTPAEDSCAYDFDFDFHFDIPAPKPVCPQFNVTGQATATTTEAEEASVTLSITATQEGSDQCDTSCATTLDFDFQFYIPSGGTGCPAQSSESGGCRSCYGGLTVQDMHILDPADVQYILGTTGDGCFGLVPVEECGSQSSNMGMAMLGATEQGSRMAPPSRKPRRVRRSKTSEIAFSKKPKASALSALVGLGFTGLVDLRDNPMLVFENGVVSQVVYPDERAVEAVVLDEDPSMGDYGSTEGSN